MEFGSLACLFFVSLLLTSYSTQAAKSDFPLCLKRTLTDVIALEGDLCYPHLLEDYCTPRVIEVGGREVKDALSRSYKGRYKFAALLFYAKWCPFSQRLRDVFDTLSILFPDINHIAIESSALWPSELSEHGVRSFPALVVQNRTLKFQFYGDRSMESIMEFYVEKTGFMPMALSYSLNEVKFSPMKQADKGRSWMKQFETWLWDYFYLAFSILFLMLRFLFYFQPIITVRLRKFWNLKERSLKAQKGISRLANAEQKKRAVCATGKGRGSFHRKEDKDNGKALRSVPSWPSPSFAAVALAECSSRNAATEDTTKKSVSVG